MVRKETLMSVPMDHNEQDNYDAYQGVPLDPSNHAIDNIPDASIQHDGTQLPTQGSSQPTPQQTKPGANASVGLQALEKLREHMQGGNTKTKGKGKK